ncbi:hypothetical protein BKK56_06635 [Rodentibacter genomosp. 2]|uniref:UvrD-helicase domain-containing protein n=1 Tax=Rodentibacter genomosp. 2 TaxID=1908266 RepID=UPI000985262D|nr:hypothetical protein BKK56_06635 [Rodentibacter genomosp. 2]
MSNVDNDIYSYVTSSPPRSFLLFAGAGSGKTRTLVNVLQKLKNNHKKELMKRNQKIAVITFTNAACEEIRHRLQYDSIFHVSTIHSFSWELIKPFTKDIKIFLQEKLKDDISDLKNKLNRARSDSSKKNYQKDIEKKEIRLNSLNEISCFIYSPVEILVGKGTLNHSEVITIFTKFITEFTLMKSILISLYPILFIDECQDTEKELLKSLIQTQQCNKETFCLGLFGDLMQQIYSIGYSELVDNLPKDWEKPCKIDNYRCPSRIVELINKINELNNPKHTKQICQKDNSGLVRLFILNNDSKDKLAKEQGIRENMSDMCKDPHWKDIRNVKTLVLEHSMAANRAGFREFFLPLSRDNIIRDNLLQKTGTSFLFLLHQFLPLVDNIKSNNHFEIMKILKKYSPLMRDEKIISDFKVLEKIIKDFNINENLSLKEILTYIYSEKLLEIPDDIQNGLHFDRQEYEDRDKDFLWNQALNATLKQFRKYDSYIKGELGFDTHQGVKGLEFPRVMAILDDNESNGFLFNYNKLLETEPLSNTDRKNIELGKDNVISRTARLFYVICSRAMESLAVVIYSNNPSMLKDNLVSSGLFKKDEIEIFN